MREVNRDFRDIDRPTDILSFPTYEFVKPGKVRVALEQATNSKICKRVHA